jgi:RNA polymerase sigma factor (sigma-70 family)
MDDIALLQRYTAHHAEDAFAELVRRHVNLVYFSALRQVDGDTGLAQDVTQTVFTDLARKAASLTSRPVLTGWLYTSTRFAAGKARRTEFRRRIREQEALAMDENTAAGEPVADWERLRPVIDDALHQLAENDREAVLLRFFENRAFAEIGRALRITEDAARKRVDRALERMAATLGRSGITSTGTALSLALTSQAAASAPAGLAGSVATGALAAAGASTAAGAGILAFMSTTKIALGTAGVIAAVAVGAAYYQANESRAAVAAAGAERDEVRAQVRDLKAQLQAQTARAQGAEEDTSKLLKAIDASGPARAAEVAAAATPITQDAVEARYKRAQDLARAGDTAAALKEFLWCFDTGMPQVSGYTGVRRSYVLSEIAKLGEADPEALAALRTRRDAAEKRLLASKNDFDAAADFSSLNHYLKEDARTLQVYDQMAPEDTRRRAVGLTIYELLVQNGRYADALNVRSYGQISSLFDMSADDRPLPANLANSERIRKAQRQYAVKQGVEGVEVLAGAGDVPHARSLATRVLAYDSSPETRSLLQQRLAKVGHPEVLEGLPSP